MNQLLTEEKDNIVGAINELKEDIEQLGEGLIESAIQSEMSVSQFLSYFSSLVPINGEIVVKNVKLVSGSFSNDNNCYTNLPEGCNKVVFQNFDTSVALQNMFYKNDTKETNLKVVMDLKQINIENAFASMFYNNASSGTYNLEVSFPELVSVQGDVCMQFMFQNNSTGTYNLEADFPKLTTIQGSCVFTSLFKNNSTGTYTLNLSIPELTQLFENINVNYTSIYRSFYNTNGGTYIINKLYLPKLVSIKQINTSTSFTTQPFTNQSNQWICLNNNTFSIDSNNVLSLKGYYNCTDGNDTQTTNSINLYIKKQISCGNYSLLYITGSSSSYTLTEADYLKLFYYKDELMYISNDIYFKNINFQKFLSSATSTDNDGMTYKNTSYYNMNSLLGTVGQDISNLETVAEKIGTVNSVSVNTIDGFIKGSSSQENVAGQINSMNNQLGNVIDEVIGLQKNKQTQMSVSEFLSYVSTLVPVNGEIVVRNVKLISGAFTTNSNCYTNLPANCNKIIFENFDTSVKLQYMFYKNNTGETNLEVVMDLKEINIDNAFQQMFQNNNSGTYNLKVSFPELISVQGLSCMYAMFCNNQTGTYNSEISFPELTTIQGQSCMQIMFYNYSTGTYNLKVSFPKLISIQGHQSTTTSMFKNFNSNGNYTLNLNMPLLQEISETNNSTSYYLCQQMFNNVGTYIINRLYIPKLATFKQVVSSSEYFGSGMFSNQSNQWIVLNNNVFIINSQGILYLKFYYNTSTQAIFDTGRYVKKQINLGDYSLLYFTSTSDVYKLTDADYQKLSYYSDLYSQIELNKYQYYFTFQKEMTVNYFLSYFSNLISIDGVIYVKNIKLTSGNFETSNNCLSNLPSGCNKIVFENFDTSVKLEYMFWKNDTTITNLEVIMDLKSINVNYVFDYMFYNNSTGTYNLKVSFPELTSVQGISCMGNMFGNYSTGTYNLTVDFPKLTSIKGNYNITSFTFLNNNSGIYTLNLNIPELQEISETTTSISYYLCKKMFYKYSGHYTINRLYLPKLTTFKQAVNSSENFGQGMFSGQSNQWICLNNNVFSIDSSVQILLKYYYNTSTSATYSMDRYIKKQINLGDCSLIFFTSSSSYTLTEADYQKLIYYEDILNGKLIKQSLDVQQLVNRIQGSDTNDYRIQIYGVDTIGYDAYRLTLSSGDEFILACSSENVYTCSGSNVSYSFNSSSNSLTVNDTTVSLTNNGTTYTGTNDSITYTIIPYEETTTNIQQAISKLNIALGTILTEMRSQNLTLFGDQISNNVSNWSSMLDYISSKIGDVSTQTIRGSSRTTLYDMILGLWGLINAQSTSGFNRYASGSTAQRSNLLNYIDGVAYTLGITPTSSTISDNGISMTIGSYSTSYGNVKNILNAMNRLIYTGSSGTLGTNYQYSLSTNTFSSSYTKSSTTYYNYKDIIQSLNTSIGYIGNCLNESLAINKFNSYSHSTTNYTNINGRISNINTAVGNVIGYLTGQQVEMSVSDFLTYFSGLKVQNGVVYVKNIKLTSGAFTTINNCYTNLPANCNKVVFENFDTNVALQYMFYKDDTTTTNLEVIMDLKSVNINSAFYLMFSNNSTGTYNLKVSFPELVSVQGKQCMYVMFQSYYQGTYNLTADFPKLITIKGEYQTVNSIFKNDNSSGTYTLNLSMPELTEISETTTSTSYYLCSTMFQTNGTYTINRLYLPKLITFKQAVSSSGYFGLQMFVNQSNQWICLNNNVFNINSSGSLSLKYSYNTSTQTTFNTGKYIKKQINLGEYSLLYFTGGSDSYTLTEADYQKLSYYPEVIGYLANKLENFTITWEELIEKSNSQNTFNNLIIKSQSHTSSQSLSSNYTNYIFNKCIFDTPLNNMFPSSVVQVAFNQCTFYQITNFNNMFLGNVVSVVFGERCRFTHGTSMSIFSNSKYLETLSINKENLDSSLLVQDSIPKIKGNGYSFSFDKPLLQNASLSNGNKYTLSFYPSITWNEFKQNYTSTSGSSLTISRKYLLDGNSNVSGMLLLYNNDNITEVIFDHIYFNNSFDNVFYNNLYIQKIKFQNCWNKQTSFNNTFYCCERLTEIDFGSNSFDNMGQFNQTFLYCFSLTSLDLSKFTCNNNSFNLSNTFKGCVSLTSITFPNVSWDIEDFSTTFYNCQSLTTLDLSNWVGNYYTNTTQNTFYDCQSLTQVKLHENFVYGNPTVDGIFSMKNTNGTQLQQRCGDRYWYVRSYSKSGSIYTINLYPYNSQSFTISLASNSNTTYTIIAQSITDTISNSPGLSENVGYKYDDNYYYYTSSTNKLTIANSYIYYGLPENSTRRILYTNGTITDTVLYRTSSDQFIVTSIMSFSNNELTGNGNTGSFYYNSSTNKYISNRVYWGYYDATNSVCYYVCGNTDTGATENTGYYMYWAGQWRTEASFSQNYGANHIFVICSVASLTSNTGNSVSVWYYDSSRKGLTNQIAFKISYNNSNYWITTSNNTITGSIMFKSATLSTSAVYYGGGQWYIFNGSALKQVYQQTIYHDNSGNKGYGQTFYTATSNITSAIRYTSYTFSQLRLYSTTDQWTGSGNTYYYNGSKFVQIYWKVSLEKSVAVSVGGDTLNYLYCFNINNNNDGLYDVFYMGASCLKCDRILTSNYQSYPFMMMLFHYASGDSTGLNSNYKYGFIPNSDNVSYLQLTPAYTNSGFINLYNPVCVDASSDTVACSTLATPSDGYANKYQVLFSISKNNEFSRGTDANLLSLCDLSIRNEDSANNNGVGGHNQQADDVDNALTYYNSSLSQRTSCFPNNDWNFYAGYNGFNKNVIFRWLGNLWAWGITFTTTSSILGQTFTHMIVRSMYQSGDINSQNDKTYRLAGYTNGDRSKTNQNWGVFIRRLKADKKIQSSQWYRTSLVWMHKGSGDENNGYVRWVSKSDYPNGGYWVV